MLQFEPEGHIYTVDGRIVPSVTQMLSRIATRAHEDEHWNSLTGIEWMNDPVAATFGTEFHRVAQITLMGGTAEFHHAMKPWVDGFHMFRRKYRDMESIIHDGRPLVERAIHCKKLDYCATPDWAVMYNGKPIIIDWKTTAITNPIHEVQVGGYARALEEFTGIKGWATWIVYIRENGYKVSERTPRQVKMDMNLFASVVNVYRMGA